MFSGISKAESINYHSILRLPAAFHPNHGEVEPFISVGSVHLAYLNGERQMSLSQKLPPLPSRSAKKQRQQQQSSLVIRSDQSLHLAPCVLGHIVVLQCGFDSYLKCVLKGVSNALPTLKHIKVKADNWIMFDLEATGFERFRVGLPLHCPSSLK